MSESLATFIATFDGGQLSDDVLARATTAVIDGLSVILAGSRSETARIVHHSLARCGQLSGQTTVLGTEHRSGMLDAVLCNGVAAHAHDYDDVLQGHTTHPTTHLLPPLLAIAEQRAVTGRELLDSYVVGLEVELGIALAMGRSHYDGGFHSTGTIGTLGAVAAACRLLGLNTDQVLNGLGIGVSSAAGLRVAAGTMVKPLHAGHAARIGVEAAYLAADGFVGPPEPLTGRFAYFDSFQGDPHGATPRWETDEAVRGTAVEVLSFKPYPCCGEATAAVEATLDLRRELSLADIDRLTVTVCPLGREVLPFMIPVTPDEARFSAPYCVGVAFIQGSLGLADFTHSAIEREEVIDLAKRVTVAVDPDMEDPGAEVEVWTTDGRHLSRRVIVPQGNSKIGLARDVAVRKFQECSAGVVEGAQAAARYADLEALVHNPDIGTLVRSLTTGGAL